jgi:hypothetical protein
MHLILSFDFSFCKNASWLKCWVNMPFGMLYLDFFFQNRKILKLKFDGLGTWAMGNSKRVESLHEHALLVAASNYILRFGFLLATYGI